MRLDDEAEGQNVENRRGGGGGFRMGGGSIGIGTIVNGAPGPAANRAAAGAAIGTRRPANDAGAVFVRRILGNTERTWQHIFRAQFNQDYPAAQARHVHGRHADRVRTRRDRHGSVLSGGSQGLIDL